MICWSRTHTTHTRARAQANRTEQAHIHTKFGYTVRPHPKDHLHKSINHTWISLKNLLKTPSAFYLCACHVMVDFFSLVFVVVVPDHMIGISVLVHLYGICVILLYGRAVLLLFFFEFFCWSILWSFWFSHINKFLLLFTFLRAEERERHREKKHTHTKLLK